ncbi:hypothetical protein E2C01_030270 [Portunus trituberculatus]|uniref:Uncharacterized protein n=1 Tax=Portunus trituberculatus TaxID=210409 RepID=A0A5B7EWV6_PORTR|nr:hypothetical protein [Portunus trituberculatus]
MKATPPCHDLSRSFFLLGRRVSPWGWRSETLFVFLPPRRAKDSVRLGLKDPFSQSLPRHEPSSTMTP